MKPCFLLPVFAAFALAASALAQSVEVFSANWGTSSPAFSDPISLGMFDSNLGTLASVSLAIDSTVTGDISAFNSTGVQQSFTNATAELDVTLTGPGGATVTTHPTAGIASGQANPGSNDFAGLTGSDSGSFSGSPLSLYELAGGGTFGSMVSASDIGSYLGTANSGVFFGGTATASGDVTVTYTFTPVPEPAAYAAFIGAAALVLAIRRRHAAC